jgi:hypothetical protein
MKLRLWHGFVFASVVAACGDSSSSTSTSTGSGGATGSSTGSGATSSTGSGIQPGSAARPIFLILMENHNWADFKGSASAPYVQTLLTTGAHAEQYFNPFGIHPSEPNYIWLEAGDNLGILGDSDPVINHKSETDHLVTLLEAAGLSWRSYQEDISGTDCPLAGVAKYAPKHNPMVFFDDVTNSNDPMAPRCIEHVRPYDELAADLTADTVADYNFLTPNLCDDGHDSCAPTSNPVKQTDDWLSAHVPAILASKAYDRGGVVIITWDEGEGGDGPIGLIVLAKDAKPGYSNMIKYDHSSTLKSVEEILGVTPLLRHAGDASTNDLADLFTKFP